MKTQKQDWIQLAILVILGVAVILSLVLPQFSQNREPDPPLSLSVLLRDTDSSLLGNARLGMEQAADELDAELRFLTLSSPNDSAEQAELLRRELEGGADGIIISPTAPTQLAQVLEGFDRPCPVVCLESDMPWAAGVIAPDNSQLGQALAQAVIDDWTGGTVLLLDTAGDCTAVLERLFAAQRALDDAGIPTHLQTAGADVLAEQLPDLLSESGSRWVMAFEPSATLAAAEAGTGCPLYGVGANAAIAARMEQGDIIAAGVWSDYAAGYLAVAQTIAAIGKEPLSPTPLTFSILREEDIYEPENQKLLFPVTA